MAFCPFLCRIWSVHAEWVGQISTVISHLYIAVTYLAVLLNLYKGAVQHTAVLATAIYRTLNESMSCNGYISIAGQSQSLNILKVLSFIISIALPLINTIRLVISSNTLSIICSGFCICIQIWC